MQTQEADYEMTEMAFRSGEQMRRDTGDDSLLVRFHLHPKQNTAETKKAGRPIMEELEFIEIMVPGNKDTIIHRPVSEQDKKRFPRQYQAFKSNLSQDGIMGTLLDDWPGINRAQVEELKFFNIRTVEQLATVSDSNAQNFMGIQKLKNEARAYLELSGISADAKAMADELEERDFKILELQQTNEDLIKRLTKLEAALGSTDDGK